MICILKLDAAREITGWIIATDLADARRQAHMCFERDLAGLLYRMEPFEPQPGRHELQTGHVMLVS